MAITYYMLQIPPYLLFAIMVVCGGLFSGLSTYLFRKYVRISILRSHNEVTGFLFLAIAGFYSLLLSFVVFVVWGELNDTRNNVSKEGSSAIGLYRDIKFYPDTIEAKQLMTVYLEFVFQVVDDEFPNMESMKVSRKTPEALNRVFYKIEHLNPKNTFQIQLVAEMFHHLNELATYRDLRMSAMETEIAAPIWMPIILGALIVIACALLMDIEHTQMHITLNILFGAFIAMLLFLIILLDHPFAGPLVPKPQSYKEIFTAEQWSKEIKAK